MRIVVGFLAIVVMALALIQLDARFGLLSSRKDQQDVVLSEATGGEIEAAVRALIYIPEDEKIVSLSFINTPEALVAVRGENEDVLPEAEVGDYYVVFENRAILYRLEENKIYDYSPIQRPE